MAKVYIVSVAVSFAAGALSTLLIIHRRLFEALTVLAFSFLIVIFNEKTGSFERLISRSVRRKLRVIGLFLLYLLLAILLLLASTGR